MKRTLIRALLPVGALNGLYWVGAASGDALCAITVPGDPVCQALAAGVWWSHFGAAFVIGVAFIVAMAAVGGLGCFAVMMWLKWVMDGREKDLSDRRLKIRTRQEQKRVAGSLSATEHQVGGLSNVDNMPNL